MEDFEIVVPLEFMAREDNVQSLVLGQEVIMKSIDDFVKKGYAVKENDRYLLTEKGVRFMNRLFARLEMKETI
ncbi:hypothetical protein [Candidatus Uabimicrobium amorphum]|uniref:HemN C-terminal domain-containing protein n=1 Tax=Uabimicrobium amorphum TaxID=2596890 RepID=A0A5S9IN36_UABAM|nr:hypothetical protein [Candidatus Uabimicrobium amorphum]BBM84466.1 hypothetical protein UABAM_02827 [Candidatus Uabimicrobium amorphum]